MNAQFLSRLALLACAGASLSSCIITGGSRSLRLADERQHHHTEHSQSELIEELGEESAEGDLESFDLQLAELELQRSMLQISADLAEAEFAVVVAKAELKDAERALENFAAERKVRLDDAQLDLDRSIGEADDAELELAELQAMYDEEDFAEKTKELVLSRGRRSVAHSKRQLAIAHEEIRQLMEVELPAEEQDLKWNIKSSKVELKSVEQQLGIALLAMKIDSMQAEYDFEEVQQEYEAGS